MREAPVAAQENAPSALGSQPVLELRAVDVAYHGDIRILQGLSLAVQPGQRVRVVRGGVGGVEARAPPRGARGGQPAPARRHPDAVHPQGPHAPQRPLDLGRAAVEQRGVVLHHGLHPVARGGWPGERQPSRQGE